MAVHKLVVTIEVEQEDVEGMDTTPELYLATVVEEVKNALFSVERNNTCVLDFEDVDL